MLFLLYISIFALIEQGFFSRLNIKILICQFYS